MLCPSIFRFGSVAPVMAAVYVAGALLILILNIGAIPAAFVRIFSEAFNPVSGVAGTGAGVFLLTMLQRVFTGPANERHKSMPDLSWRETLIVVPLLVLVFWAGISPKTWLMFSQLIP